MISQGSIASPPVLTSVFGCQLRDDVGGLLVAVAHFECYALGFRRLTQNVLYELLQDPICL